MTLLRRRMDNTLLLVAAALVFVSAARVFAQTYEYEGSSSVSEYVDTAYGFGVDTHDDGQGVTTRLGDRMIEERSDGSWTSYKRDGDWEYRQHNTGVVEYWFYDDVNQVQKYDIRDPNSGTRVIGENPYPTNPYGIKWRKRVPGW